MTLSQRYREAAARVVAAETERDALVVAAHEQGTSIRAIGRELGISHEMARKILRRARERGANR